MAMTSFNLHGTSLKQANAKKERGVCLDAEVSCQTVLRRESSSHVINTYTETGQTITWYGTTASPWYRLPDLSVINATLPKKELLILHVRGSFVKK